MHPFLQLRKQCRRQAGKPAWTLHSGRGIVPVKTPSKYVSIQCVMRPRSTLALLDTNGLGGDTVNMLATFTAGADKMAEKVTKDKPVSKSNTMQRLLADNINRLDLWEQAQFLYAGFVDEYDRNHRDIASRDACLMAANRRPMQRRPATCTRPTARLRRRHAEPQSSSVSPGQPSLYRPSHPPLSPPAPWLNQPRAHLLPC